VCYKSQINEQDETRKSIVDRILSRVKTCSQAESLIYSNTLPLLIRQSDMISDMRSSIDKIRYPSAVKLSPWSRWRRVNEEEEIRQKFTLDSARVVQECRFMIDN